MPTLLKRFLGRYKLSIVALLVLTPIEVFADLKLPDLMSGVIDVDIAAGEMSGVLGTSVQMLAWAVVGLISTIGAMYLSVRIAMGFGRDVRHAVFGQVERLSPDEFDRFGTSSLLTRCTNDTTQIERFLNTLFSSSLLAPFMLVGAVLMSLSRSLELSLILLAIIPVALAFVTLMVKMGLPLMRRLQGCIDHLNLVTRENLTGMRVIRAYNRESWAQDRFGAASADLADANVEVSLRMGALVPGVLLVINLAIVLIIRVGGESIYAGTFLVGDLMAVIQYAALVSTSVMMLSLLFSAMPRAIAAGERILEVLDFQPAVEDPADSDVPSTAAAARAKVVDRDAQNTGERASAGDFGAATDNRRISDVKHPCAPHDCLGNPGESSHAGAIVFERVSFSYPGADEPALDGIDLALPVGRTTVVIGSTGAGKSTLFELVLRFMDPTAGTVWLDGCDISQMTQRDLRERISYVPQHVQLFADTVEANILVGEREATDERVRHVARIAAADRFVEELDGDYKHLLSQGGRNLSGGQRQRIALARALLCDAEVYLLDDPFSALDFRTESEIRCALRRELAGRTVVVVTQRIGVAMDADEVVVLDEGRIAGKGTHAELLESCAVYREIASSQLDGLKEGELR